MYSYLYNVHTILYNSIELINSKCKALLDFRLRPQQGIYKKVFSHFFSKINDLRYILKKSNIKCVRTFAISLTSNKNKVSYKKRFYFLQF